MIKKFNNFINESESPSQFLKDLHEDILEIRDVFQEHVDEFDLEDYEDCDDDTPGLFYKFSYSRRLKRKGGDMFYEIYLHIIPIFSTDTYGKNAEKFKKLHKSLPGFYKRLENMGYVVDYPLGDGESILQNIYFVGFRIKMYRV